MAKPDILRRLKNINEDSVVDELVAFAGTDGYKVKGTGIDYNNLSNIVANNKNVLDHLSNTKIHITQKEKETITQAKQIIDAHIDNENIHVSAVDKASWNNKETQEGAQQKVNVVLTIVNRHIGDKQMHVSNNDRLSWNNKYTKEEIDNKFSQLEYDNIWKESVETFTELISKYPSPQKGWTVTCNEDNITYRYDGNDWIPISANSIPLATVAVDGKMAKEDKLS